MKSIKSFAAAILVTVISSSLPMTVNAAQIQSLKMRVITQNLIINKNDIKQISLLESNTTHGVNLTLTDSAAQHLSQLSSSNLQKTMQLSMGDHIINEVVIQGNLGAQFQITTKSDEMAQTIYKALSTS